MFRRLLAISAGVTAGLLAYVGSGFAFPDPVQPALLAPLQARAAAAPDVPVAGLKLDSTPVRLVIPAIGVDAKIEARGLDAQRNLDTPGDFRDVAWYRLGPRPGQPGNAILNGHVNWWTGSAVFTHLSRLRAGDVVRIVRADGSSVTFRVASRQVVGADARVESLFAPSRASTVTLITCSGAWNPLTRTDTQRLLVSATLA
jgi:LPXTG-site transpeptidase (sortase) family protein